MQVAKSRGGIGEAQALELADRAAIIGRRGQ